MNKDEQYKAKLEAIGEKIKNILQDTADKKIDNPYVTRLEFNGTTEESEDEQSSKDKIQYGFGENDDCCS